MDRQEIKRQRRKAWSRYLSNKCEKTQVELVEAYRPMIEWMAWNDYGRRTDLEDIKAEGMLGVLEATEKIDISRVKSVDAYVAMVARSRMINYMQKLWNREVTTAEYSLIQLMEGALERNVDIDLQVDLRMALDGTVELPEVRERLVGYQPLVMANLKDRCLQRYKAGQISIREVARNLGVSRRQACKLLDQTYA